MGKINLIAAPYDSGHFNERMGAGPLHIIDHGLVKKLELAGHQVNYEQIKLDEKFPAEIASTMKLLNKIRESVDQVRDKSFPIILSGNCSSTVGVVAALNNDDLGVVWFDAHGDCKTPETSTSGFLDGMGIPMLTYSCWRNILSSYDLRCNIQGKQIALIGARQLSKHEKEFIAEKEINHITVSQIEHDRENIIRSACNTFIENGIKKLHIHIDVDVLDPSIAPANSYSVDDGISKEDLIKIITYCIRQIPVTSLTIASYDPLYDIDNRILRTIHELIQIIVKEIDMLENHPSD